MSNVEGRDYILFVFSKVTFVLCSSVIWICFFRYISFQFSNEKFITVNFFKHLNLQFPLFHWFCHQINLNNSNFNCHAISIRYQSLVDEFFPVHSNTSTKKYIITHKEYRALRVICMPYLIHSSNTMISVFFTQFNFSDITIRSAKTKWK